MSAAAPLPSGGIKYPTRRTIRPSSSAAPPLPTSAPSSARLPSQRQAEREQHVSSILFAEEDEGEQEERMGDRVEEVLINHGYKPKDKIIVSSPQGNSARYVRATNTLGQDLYVMIDDASLVHVSPDHVTTMEMGDASVIPHSIKVGVTECVGYSVAGVAFDLNETVCTLTWNEVDPNPIETTFVYAEKKREAYGLLEGETPYPIVRYSEIVANPDLVLENTNAATKSLHEEMYRLALRDLQLLQEEIHHLSDACSRFIGLQQEAATKLSSTLAQLENINSYYNGATLAPEDLEKYQQVQYNLERRNQLLRDLLIYCRQASVEREHIAQHVEHLEELNSLSEQEFQGVEYVL